MLRISLIVLLAVIAATTPLSAQGVKSIVDELNAVGTQTIVADAMLRGDANRGAILFHQMHMQCAKCHGTGDDESLLGPNLAAYESKVDRAYLVESILKPSQKIREGYQTVVAITEDGEQRTGIFVRETAGSIVLRDASGKGEETILSKSDLEHVSRPAKSIMPEGLVTSWVPRSSFGSGPLRH